MIILIAAPLGIVDAFLDFQVRSFGLGLNS
jgi:hypothetical protein